VTSPPEPSDPPVADALGALEGDHQRQVELDDRGMFPGTLAP
jgi:hypothetical protein